MKAFKKWLFQITDTFESVKGFTIIRRGLTSAIPIIVIGSFALMLISLPIPSYQAFLGSLFNGRLVSFLTLIYSSCFDILSLYMVIVISYKYAVSYTENQNSAIIVPLIALASFGALNGNVISGKTAGSFDSTMFFSAILCAVLSAKMYLLLTQKIKIFSPHATGYSNTGFNDAVKSILPACIIIAVFAGLNFLISGIFKVDSLQGLFIKLVEMLAGQIKSGYAAMLLYSFLSQFLWFFGIHGSNVLQPIADQIFNPAEGQTFSLYFYSIYAAIGGSGLCICIVLAMLLTSRTKKVRSIAKLGALPALFNISEIVTIGLPILLNPIFLIPYLFTPAIAGSIAYFATYIGLVPPVSGQIKWTTPVFLSGYYATGSIAGSLLQLVILIVVTLCYIPFLKMYEEKLYLAESNQIKDLVTYLNECEKAQKSPDFLKRNDSIGQTAKTLAAELKYALKDGSIYFCYQPQTNASGHCIGCEALVRWKHPVVGFVYPPLIIELAKEADLLKDVDALLIQRSCELIRELGSISQSEIKVSINVTVASILRNDLESMIDDSLQTYEVSPASLWIELTENEAFTSTANVSNILEQLQANGHKLLIDDFGMGYTSLKYLQTNKFNIVKLDGSLTRDILDNEVNQKIIHSIVELGSTLGFDIIAEYVETAEQRDKLSELGCKIYQGYYFSPPLEKEDFIQYYKDHRISQVTPAAFLQ